MKSNVLWRQSKSGFSLLEFVFASALFLLFSTAVILLALQSIAIQQQSAEYLVAASYANEGREAVRFIRQAGFSALGTLSEGDIEQNDEVGLRFLYGPNTYGIYERRITVTDIDPISKRIEVTVAWPVGSSDQHSITLTDYVFDWQYPY